MKVVHVIKKIESIDNDVKELRKLEKSITKDKSFSTPIYMTIEKQINILLGDRIKLLELTIANPPANMAGEEDLEEVKSHKPAFQNMATSKKTNKSKAKAKTKKASTMKKDILAGDIDDIPMLTQDVIDKKIDNISTSTKKEAKTPPNDSSSKTEKQSDEGIKLLDVALEKGSLNKKVMEKERKVKFFRENFPSD